MSILLRRGLLVVASSPAFVAAAFLVADAGLVPGLYSSEPSFWRLVGFLALGLMLPIGTLLCVIAVMRLHRDEQPISNPALVATAGVCVAVGCARYLLARAQGVPEAVVSAASAQAAPGGAGRSGAVGLLLTAVVVVAAIVVMRRMRRLVD